MSDASQKPATGNRLAKVIARAGLCSRREAEQWIAAGRVTVNGKAVRTPAFNVTDSDKITVDGNPLVQRSGTRVWLYHKPAGLVVTENDPEGRETIFQALETKGLPRVLTVGRLDINTEGLLLLTNDGGLKRVLEHPSTGWLRRYRVRAHGRVTQDKLDGLKKGIEVDGIKYGPIEAHLEREQGSNVWITLALREGKNREVKNVLGVLGLQVTRLIRTSFGPFQLGDIPVGAVTVVRNRVLQDQLGQKLAAQAGVDFASPLPEDPEQPVRRPAPRGPGRPGASRAEKPAERGRDGAHKVRGKPEEPRGRGKPAGRDARDTREAPRDAPPTRRVLFNDGREPEEFTPRARPEGKDKRGGAPRGKAGPGKGRPGPGKDGPRKGPGGGPARGPKGRPPR